MKMIFRKLTTLLTLVVFLLTTNGISMIEHYCAEDHESFIFFFHSHPTCEDHEHQHQTDDCCESSCSHDNHEEHHCCSNNNRLLKLIADYLSGTPTNEISCPVFIAENIFAWVYTQPEKEIQELFTSGVPPNVTTSGQSIIKQNSQFIL